MSMALAEFRHAMEKHAAERERLVDEAERRYMLREKTLTGYEQISMQLALSDEIVLEHLRVAAWENHGARSHIPAGFPLGMTAEIQWRYENITEDEND